MPFSRKTRDFFRSIAVRIARSAQSSRKQFLPLQIFLGVVWVSLFVTWLNAFETYQDEHAEVTELIAEEKAGKEDLPPITPPIVMGIGSIVVALGAANSLRLSRGKLSSVRRVRLVQWSLWIVAAGVLIAWLPTDFAESQSSLFGRSFIGERPSSIAYAGKLILMGLLVLSFPIAAWMHFRSSLLDQYMVRNFLTPFSFCLIGFVAIWLIADFTDNATDLAGAHIGLILKFYVIQLPYMILFVMPVTLLLSLLYSLSRMSKNNEIISILGAGRSMLRTLKPLFIVGIYCSLICLAFKYEWAPKSVGYKEGLLEEIYQAKKDRAAGRNSKKLSSPWARVGWLHVNEIDRRTWFVGKVPLDMRKRPMANVAIWQFGADGKPLHSFRCKSAKWFFGPRSWRLSNGKTYTYSSDGIPRIQSWEFLDIPGWRETPWKVLSSSQNPEHLGVPDLSTYLKSNADYDDASLAPFRTNWWYCWSEPLGCLVMVLIAAPLGIVYSRRGVLGGVAASIIIFALIYFLNGTFLALGQGGYVPPFIAAWATNLIFSAIGVFLLIYRARNRELPTLKVLLSRFRARKALAAARAASTHSLPKGQLTPGSTRV